jgi:hypothetical protein
VPDINEIYDSEQEQRNPKDIALAVFRFRARRGIGFFYALLSIAPLVATLLAYISAPAYVTQISIPVIIIMIWLFARAAGMQGFNQMYNAISLFEGKEKKEKPRNKLIEILKRGFVSPILPLVAIVIFDLLGLGILAFIVLITWIAAIVFYDIFAFSKKSSDSIVRRRIEDWLVLFLVPTILLLLVFRILSPVICLPSLSVILLAAGVKSLYEAPEELVQSFE